jgi:HD-like signal output (HDOD) protein
MQSIEAIEQHLDDPQVRHLIKDLGVPPRPSALVDIQQELQREDPRMHVLTQIVTSDVAMSGALLKVANSPWAGLSRRAENIQQAFMLLGLSRCEHILTEIALRDALPAGGPALLRFWDVSSKRAHAMALLAGRAGLQSSMAQTFGLFADVGIPLLAQRFKAPSYLETLEGANQSDEAFTDLEQRRHQADHTVVGALLSRSWGVSQTVVLAQRLHHDYSVFTANAPTDVKSLVALGLVCEYIIQRYAGLNRHGEWHKGGAAAMGHLGISDDDLQSWCDDLHDRFSKDV